MGLASPSLSATPKATSCMPFYKRLLLSGCLVILCGCPSIPPLKYYMRGAIGQPIEVTRQRMARKGSYASSIGWKERTYNLPNGNWVYVEPAYPDCLIHWEVNPKGIKVGARAEGKGCARWIISF